MTDVVDVRTGEIMPVKSTALALLPDAERMLAECVRVQDALHIEGCSADSARLFCEGWAAGADGDWTGRDDKGAA